MTSHLPLERTTCRIPNRQAKIKILHHGPSFSESRFPGRSQILFPVKLFCVFPNPAPYFRQTPDPENTLPDPVLFLISTSNYQITDKRNNTESAFKFACLNSNNFGNNPGLP